MSCVSPALMKPLNFAVVSPSTYASTHDLPLALMVTLSDVGAGGTDPSPNRLGPVGDLGLAARLVEEADHLLRVQLQPVGVVVDEAARVDAGGQKVEIARFEGGEVPRQDARLALGVLQAPTQ